MAELCMEGVDLTTLRYHAYISLKISAGCYGYDISKMEVSTVSDGLDVVVIAKSSDIQTYCVFMVELNTSLAEHLIGQLGPGDTMVIFCNGAFKFITEYAKSTVDDIGDIGFSIEMPVDGVNVARWPENAT